MTEDKIPKVIHYCWFSGDEMPAFISQCIATWKQVMPDYRLRVWDAASFDFDSVPFVKEAFAARKWAFVADYIRLYALYHEGGIYLDSDVRVFKRFDEFLKYNFFTSHEIHPLNFTDSEKAKLDDRGVPLDPRAYIYGLNIQAAMMGGAAGCKFLRECMEFYHDKHLLNADGSASCEQFIIGPFISKIAEKYGYRYLGVRQQLDDNMIVLEPEVFVGNSAFLNSESYAIHLCNGGWKEKTAYEEFKFRVRNDYPSLSSVLPFAEKIARNVKKLFKP